MVIHRHEPGEPAPIAGRYALVGHFGEATNLIVVCDEGERLPDITVASDLGPFWFVRVNESHEQARVA